MRRVFLVLALILATPAAARESVPGHSGEVRVPLSAYTALLSRLTKDPRPARIRPARAQCAQELGGVGVRATGPAGREISRRR